MADKTAHFVIKRQANPEAEPYGEEFGLGWRPRTSPGREPHVVIVGAGFGGLYAARALHKAPVQVTVIDRQNYHLFQPLLYQVATAALPSTDVAYPIRAVLGRQKNTSVVLAEAVGINTSERKVILRDGEEAYDYLILATGARHSYFHHAEWEEYAPGLKNLEDALEIRRRILLAFEKAERESDAARRQALLTFVVVGGGPTGVELAGAIAEIACKVIAHDFRNIDPCETRTILLEAGPRILASFPEDLSAKAEIALKKLCVQIRTNTPVTSIKGGSVTVGDQQISAATVLWAAGVAASPLVRSLGVPLDRAGRVRVKPDLTVDGHPEIFVVGDLAALNDENGKLLPGLAPVAIQEGRHAAQNVICACRGETYLPFRYVHSGALATIGRGAAVADFGPIKLSGFLAWIAWVFVHILFLIGFRNRFLVLFEWAWAFFTFQRSARLIVGEVRGTWPVLDQGPSSDGDQSYHSATPPTVRKCRSENDGHQLVSCSGEGPFAKDSPGRAGMKQETTETCLRTTSSRLCQPEEVRDRMLDKTIADSFPASDPPSSIPDPAVDSFGLETGDSARTLPERTAREA